MHVPLLTVVVSVVCCQELIDDARKYMVSTEKQ
jgi:hypothetical protein